MTLFIRLTLTTHKWLAVAVLLMSLVVSLSLSSQAHAQGYSIEQVVKKVKGKHKGKVLQAKPGKFKGQEVYKIKMLSPESKVYYLYIDPKSGKPLRNK